MEQNLFILCVLGFAANVIGQTGFTSIDCGSEQSSYNDIVTGINYTFDSPYIDTGVNMLIPDPSSLLPIQYQTVRSFPTENRNCYTLDGVNSGDKYLVRASFMYGNYDGLNTLPQFDVYLGIDLWFTVKFDNSTQVVWGEIISVAATSSIVVCLVNSDSGTPFISALEFRLLRRALYQSYFDGNVGLVTWNRFDVGSSVQVRYPEDLDDRIWAPDNSNNNLYKTVTSTKIVNGTIDEFDAPQAVMQTALESNNSNTSIQISWSGDPTSSFNLIMYFTELENLNNGGERGLITYYDGSTWGSPVIVPDGAALAYYSVTPLTGQSLYTFSIHSLNATLGALLNAFEVFEIKNLSASATSLHDASAILDIKTRYSIKKNWMGDPCLPRDYHWDGLGCNYDDPINSIIISLDLSASNLTGEISDFISKLTSIQSINLANNSLSGSIPDSLGSLANLIFLNLEGNQLNGTIPPTLEERIQNGSLILRVDNQVANPMKTSNFHNKMLVVAIVVPTVVTLILLLLVTLAIKLKIRKQVSLTSETMRAFMYKEVVEITQGFQRVIGRGGSGTIYHGFLKDGQEVAVKVLNASHSTGPDEFSAEVKMLMTIHHRYLASFIGFCEEGRNMILIYEYVSYGNLGDLLSGKGKNNITLTWEQRLRIALTAAQGLEYLHYGCKQPIIHRDVKTANILVNERLEAKIADFGLSKIFPSESVTHVTTVVGGTRGYLDPEYYITNKLTEKSDVYSFGTVLLELITGRPAIITIGDEWIQILYWVKPMLESGDIEGMVDPKLGGDYDANSIWKVAEVSVSCMAESIILRPTMSQVVGEIKEAMNLEVERLQTKSMKTSELIKTPLETSSLVSQFDIETLFGPSAR